MLPSVWNRGDKDFETLKDNFLLVNFSPKQSVCLANVFEMKHIELTNFPTNNIVFLDMLD